MRKTYLLKSSKLKNALKKQGVILAYLFGSEAMGQANTESDVDIGVLLSDEIKKDNYFEKSIELPDYFKELYPDKERIVTVLNESSPLLKHRVLVDGRLMYCKSDDERVKFHTETVKEYEDTKHLFDIQSYYLKKQIKQGTFGHPKIYE